MSVERGAGWEMHLGDCRDVLPPPAFVLVTDPPYGIGLGSGGGRHAHGLLLDAYRSHDDSPETFPLVAEEVARFVSLATRAAVFMGGANIGALPRPDALGGVYLPGAVARSRWGFTSLAPVCFYGTAPNLHKGARATVISSGETAEKNGHPVPKPIGWMLWLVGLASLPDETVVDPFAGSGTTGVACLRLGRKFVGIEKDPTYFALCCERLRAEENNSTLVASRAGQETLFGKVSP